jgi:DNA invertase Pin-like site-specific DNA recombinase
MIRERTIEGLDAARERHGGTLPGRGPSITADQTETVRTLAANSDMSAERIASVIGVSRATLYRHVPVAEIRAALGREAGHRRVPGVTAFGQHSCADNAECLAAERKAA